MTIKSCLYELHTSIYWKGCKYYSTDYIVCAVFLRWRFLITFVKYIIQCKCTLCHIASVCNTISFLRHFLNISRGTIELHEIINTTSICSTSSSLIKINSHIRIIKTCKRFIMPKVWAARKSIVVYKIQYIPFKKHESNVLRKEIPFVVDTHRLWCVDYF